MTRKRSSYRPKRVNLQAHLLAIQGACCLSKDDALARAWAVSLAVADIAKGVHSVQSLKAICYAVNMAEAFCDAGLCKDESHLITDTERTVAKVVERGQDAPTPEELAMLVDFAANYGDIVSRVTHQEYFAAEQLVLSRVRRALAGEVSPTDIVITLNPQSPTK